MEPWTPESPAAPVAKDAEQQQFDETFPQMVVPDQTKIDQNQEKADFGPNPLP